MQIITSPTASLVFSFQDQHIAKSLHFHSWAREHYRESSTEVKVQQGKGRKKNLLCGAPACSQGCCSLQRALAGSTPAPYPSPHDKRPSAGHRAQPTLPDPGAGYQLWPRHSHPSSSEEPTCFFSFWDWLLLKSTTLSGLEAACGCFEKVQPHLKPLERKQQQQQQNPNASECFVAQRFLWLGITTTVLQDLLLGPPVKISYRFLGL